MRWASVLALVTALCAAESIPAGAKVFIPASADGFDSYILSAFDKKKVPLTVVASKEEADFTVRVSCNKVSRLETDYRYELVLIKKEGGIAYNGHGVWHAGFRGETGVAEHAVVDLAKVVK